MPNWDQHETGGLQAIETKEAHGHAQKKSTASRPASESGTRLESETARPALGQQPSPAMAGCDQQHLNTIDERHKRQRSNLLDSFGVQKHKVRRRLVTSANSGNNQRSWTNNKRGKTVTYETIQVDEMSPACGAIIEGLDLSTALTNRQFDEIHSALLDRTVLIFRDQNLTQAQQSEFARRFGDVQPSAVSGFEKSDEHPDVDILEYDSDNPPHVTKDLWHTDFVGTPKPTMGTVLYAKDIPPEGGDTIWVNGIAAYDALSDRMKAHLDGLWAYNDRFQAYDLHVRPELWDADYQEHLQKKKAEYHPALHPVVRTHPVSGKKGLFVNESMTSFIKDMDRKESDMLLRYLFDYLRTPEFQYRHKWEVNDLAIWDNRTSLHYALFDYTEHRLMHRIVIQGDVPHAD